MQLWVGLELKQCVKAQVCVRIGRTCSSFWRVNLLPIVRCTWLPGQAASRSLLPVWRVDRPRVLMRVPLTLKTQVSCPECRKKCSQDSLDLIPRRLWIRLWIGTDLPFFSHGSCHIPAGYPILLLPSRCALSSEPGCGCSYSQHLPAVPCSEPP